MIISISINIFLIILILLLIIKYYPNIRLVCIDIYRGAARVLPTLRKSSCKYEIENSLNFFSKNLNSSFSSPLLHECEIKWVNAGNSKAIFEAGKVIMRVNFDEDHDINYYNATSLYIQKSLLYRSKPFIKEETKRAIDLETTKILLSKARRQVLPLFNDNFNKEVNEVQDKFRMFDETEERGLFTRVFLTELNFAGDINFTKTPSAQIQKEIEEFTEWFYQLATRGTEDNTNLKFEKSYIKTGVILVANEDTYKKYGNEAYVRRALTYVDGKFDCIFIISRGIKRATIANDIALELEQQYGFDILTRDYNFPLIDEAGNKHLNTCIGLKPNSITLVQKAWEKIKNLYQENTLASVTIDLIEEEQIRVNIFGIRTFIPKERLTGCEINDIQKYFVYDQELKVKILEFIENEKIILSNIGTETDPKRIIDLQLSSLDIKTGTITRIRHNGIVVNFADTIIAGFIPRRELTFSRYAELTEKYKLNNSIDVQIRQYDPMYDNFVCSINNLDDPWNKNDFYLENHVYDVIIREIRERYMTCELEEGVEGKIYETEICWDSSQGNCTNFMVGQEIKTFIIKINKENRNIILSIKRVEINPAKKFFDSNNNLIHKAIISDVKYFGIDVLLDNKIRGFIPISEIQWGYCSVLPDNFRKDEAIDVCLLKYDEFYGTIECSCKRRFKNEFEDIKLNYIQDQIITGRVYNISNRLIYFKIKVGKYEGFGYIHKSKISNSFYIKDEDLENIFDKNMDYHFQIIRPDEQNQVFELSRKEVLQKNLDNIDFGIEYNGMIFGSDKKNMKFYSDIFEGIVRDEQSIKIGRINVLIARKDQILELFVNN